MIVILICFFWKKPYETDFDKYLLRNNLKPLNKDIAQSLYHRFATIMRKHSVSDKSNAYNKLFNLFLCKIIDEDKQETAELAFQHKKNDTDIKFLKRLSDLYKEGMDHFLNKEISDLSDIELEKFGSSITEELRQKIDELRLYKNNEFAFIEVFNKESFLQNSKIVKEVVQLLQHYQFRYGHKHQYLGDFFENLLNTGFKQENGQFFTPIPVTETIIKALPLQNIIQNNKSLPFIIDYACGSGHFLTEVIDEIQNIIPTIDTSGMDKTPRNNFESWSTEGQAFTWAKEYIYGIDIDYRLVKTTKVACFLNGDGEANIIHSNGLNSFGSKDFKGKLAKQEQFDVVLANPPYSVGGFLNLIDNKDSFSIYAKTPETSNDIECFFIERTYQLLKEDGVAAIVLPISMFTNNGLHDIARRYLLVDFELLGIISLSGKAFMETSTSAVIVFLRKRNKQKINEVKNIIEEFINNPQDMACNGIENVFSQYTKDTKDNMYFDEYIEHIKSKTLDCEIEREKLLVYILTNSIILPIFQAGNDTEKAKQFLGYEFSKRKNQEGINIFDKNSPLTKTSSIILQSFNGTLKDNFVFDKDMEEYSFITKLSNQINWQSDKNWRSLRLAKIKHKIDYSKYPIVRLQDTSKFNLSIGDRVIKKDIKSKSEGIPIYSANVYEIFGFIDKDIIKDFSTPSILWGIDGDYLTRYIEENNKFYPTDHCGVLRVIDEGINPRYISFILQYIGDNENYSRNVRASIERMKMLKVPLPKKEIQDFIAQKCEKLDSIEQSKRVLINENNNKINSIIQQIGMAYSSLKIGEIAFLGRGRVINKDDLYNNKGEYPVYSSQTSNNGVFGYIDTYDFDGEYLTWTTDGANAGTVFYRNNKFNCTNVCGTIKLKPKYTTLIDIYYLYIFLNSVTKKYVNYVGNPKLMNEDMYEIKIPILEFKKQLNIKTEIMDLEYQIKQAQEDIDSIEKQKKEILKKYLE